jgi:hypothetical protein
MGPRRRRSGLIRRDLDERDNALRVIEASAKLARNWAGVGGPGSTAKDILAETRLEMREGHLPNSQAAQEAVKAYRELHRALMRLVAQGEARYFRVHDAGEVNRRNLYNEILRQIVEASGVSSPKA